MCHRYSGGLWRQRMLSSEAKTLTLRRPAVSRRSSGTAWRCNVSVFASLHACVAARQPRRGRASVRLNVERCHPSVSGGAARRPNKALHRTAQAAASFLMPHRAAGEGRR